jgi:hypothetical protein
MAAAEKKQEPGQVQNSTNPLWRSIANDHASGMRVAERFVSGAALAAAQQARL